LVSIADRAPRKYWVVNDAVQGRVEKMEHKDKQYRVHKFGGSSLADAAHFAAIKPLLTGQDEIIVVSAVKDVTSTLQELLDDAQAERDFLAPLLAVEKKHITLIKDLILAAEQNQLIDSIQADCAIIKDILHAVQLIRSYSKETQDLVLGYGEQWSAKVLTAYLSQYASVIYLDAATVLFVYDKNGMLCIDWDKSQQALHVFLHNKSFQQLVVTGFIAAKLNGQRTTLGRNGSDFSGAIFAKLFHAECLTIWTDVDGIFSADPRRVRSAFAIESMSYNEALELAYFGAKVLHPMTIAPVLEAQIPLVIKNTNNPSAKGTYISALPEKSSHPVRGLTCVDNVALINIEGSGMIGVSGIAARVFQVMHQATISVILISQASSEHSICFAVLNTQAEAAKKALTENLQFELERKQIEKITVDASCAILAAVGDAMVGSIGVLGKLCDTLAKANVNIRAVAQGSSERNISIVIQNEDINRALQAVHAGFYLSNKTISIGLIGCGQVGSTLLRQIQVELAQLKEKYQVNLCVRGIMNSKKMLLQHESIDLLHWQDTLEQQGVLANQDEFINHIYSADMPHAVIIDCTANKNIAQHYLKFMAKGIHVITPNKHANAGDLAYYKKLKALTEHVNSHYLYEATVCAGLPVITTLQDIIKTGDEVRAVSGVVSGTLSFVFSEMGRGLSFSEAVLAAKAAGYTEPDPREDLSGMDVARKLICLAREIGHDVSLADVHVHDLVPAELKQCSVDEFMLQLRHYDEPINKMVADAAAKQQKLYYVGTVHHNGAVTVAIEAHSVSHPFAALKATDNMLIFTTRRYDKQPLVIQGPGAGAEVTAAGVFADLLRLVSYLS
jgi:aspartokinase/homoserine dehydrogenase 1